MARPRDEARQVGRQMLQRLADPSQLDLHIWFRAGYRQPLQPNDRVEIWRGSELVGQLSGDSIHALITQHLATAALQAAMLHELVTLRQPRTVDQNAPGPVSGPSVPLPAEPPVLSAKAAKTEERYASRREKAPGSVKCGVVAPETGRVFGFTVPCRHHPKQGGGPSPTPVPWSPAAPAHTVAADDAQRERLAKSLRDQAYRRHLREQRLARSVGRGAARDA